MAIAFDPTYYLLNNPDVALAVSRGTFASAYDHFIKFGASELRSPNADFNALEYAAMNPDVLAAVNTGKIASVWDHYVQFGLAENRAPNASLAGFDAAAYLAINNDVAAAVTAGAFKSAIEHYLDFGKAEGRQWGNETSLTNGTDKLVANNFVAGLVYTPGGNDRINSLQDEDELTGIGQNPTLTATLGNSNDNGATTITPILTGIETVNVAFSGSGTGLVTTLDLQDATGLTGAVNVTRISLDVGPVGITNMASVPAELSVSNNNAPTSGVLFQFLDTATAGTADVTKLTVSNVDMNNLAVRSKNGNEGIETINLVTTGTLANRIGNLTAQDLVTLTISGSQNLSIGSIDDGNVGQFRSIDGSAATGNLTLSLDSELKADMEGTSGTGKAVDFQLKTGSGNDTLIVDVAIAGNVADIVNLGSGTDTVHFTGDDDMTFTNATTATFKGVEAVQVVRTGSNADVSLVVDMSRLDSDTGTDQSIRLTNSGSTGRTSFILDKLSAGEANLITVTHSATGQNGIADNQIHVNLADESGKNDHVTVTIVDGVNTDARFNFDLFTNGVENVTLIDNDTESNSVGLVNYGTYTGTVTLKGGIAGQFMNLDVYENTLRKAKDGTADDTTGFAASWGNAWYGLSATVIDAESYVGDVIVRVTSPTAEFSATGAQSIRMGVGNDAVIFDNLDDSRAGLTISDTVSGGAGDDTLMIAGNRNITLGLSEWTNVTGFETIQLVGNGPANWYHLTLSDSLVTRNAADGKRIHILNDNEPANDTNPAGASAYVTDTNNATIDARQLSAGLSFSYKGDQGVRQTNDRFIMTDAQVNGSAIIDGGSIRDTTIPGGANGDVLEIRNAAVISTGDLANIKNVGVIELTNDTASHQHFSMQLNDAIVDAMADSEHAATLAQPERITIRALDNAVLSTAHSILDLDATALTGIAAVRVYGGGGADKIMLGAGSDYVTGGAGNDTISGGAGNDSIIGDAGNDSIDGGDGDDSINGGLGNDTITAGEGADRITIGEGEDWVTLTETTAATDTLVWNTAFAAGYSNFALVVDFAFGTGANSDIFDFQQNLSNGTTTATSNLAAQNWVSLGDSSVATANDILFKFDSGRTMAATSNGAEAITNAVAALTTGGDFAATGVDAGDSFLLLMRDGGNSFLFHYVAGGTITTTEASDLSLIAVFNGNVLGTVATGDFI